MNVVASPSGRPPECLDDGFTIAETRLRIGHGRTRLLEAEWDWRRAASAGQVRAQAVHPKPTLGILAGIDLATLGGSNVSNAGSRTGVSIGGFATFHVTNQFGIEPELLFTQRGAHESSDGDDITLKLDYIDIPVLARFDVPMTNSTLRPFFLAGPTFSFQVSCDAEESGEGGSISSSCDNLNNQTGGGFSKKSFDTGATLGAGIGFPVDKK